MAMGTSVAEIQNADNAATNVLYQSNDFGTKTPDPSKPFKRYYAIMKSERRKYQPIWRSTRDPIPDYSQSVTYLNWEINDIADNQLAETKIVGKLYATYYFKFRRPRLDNIDAD